MGRATTRGYNVAMRAVMLEAPQSLIEERRRLGLDGLDEMWEGVLHMVPPPSQEHQRVEGRLFRALSAIAETRGLEAYTNFGVFGAAEQSYRVPDVVVAAAIHTSKRGVEGRAELVVEILSPNDESYDKLPFYAARGIPEVWIVDPVTRVAEVYALRDGRYVLVPSAGDGSVDAPVLALQISLVDGPRLRIVAAEGTVDV
jgi:Uma2 family endonuclease